LKPTLPIELTANIIPQVLVLRGQRVLLAQQLATLYGVETRVLTQAVRRNAERFPIDFMFVLENQDLASLRSQFVILSEAGVPLGPVLTSQFVTQKQGAHSKYRPYAFTEQGIAMLSSVIKSEQAIAVNIEIMRAFVRMRGILSEHKDLKRSLNALERKYDDQFRIVFDAIRELMTPPAGPKKRQIGFVHDAAKTTKPVVKAKKK
jgi:ORF6N domain